MLIRRELRGGPFDGTEYVRDIEEDPPPSLSVRTNDGHAVYRLVIGVRELTRSKDKHEFYRWQHTTKEPS